MIRKILIGYLFCLGALPCLQSQQKAPSQTAKQESVETDISVALQAYEAGQLTRAIAILKEAYGRSPANPQVRLYLGLFLYEKSKDSFEAQRLMESVIGLFPSNTDLQLRLLDSYLSTKNDVKSKALIGRFQSRMSADSRFAFNVIYTLIHYGQIDAAKTEIGKVSAGLQGEILFIGGLISLASQDGSEALKRFEGAMGKGFPPRDSSHMLTIAESCFRLREFPMAARAYEAYLENRPRAAPPLRFQLGLSYYGYGDFDRALEQMLQVQKQAPQLPEVNFYLGSILIELRKPEEARPYLQAELKNDPASYKAMTKMAYLEYLAGNDDICRQWLERSLAANAAWFETHMVYGLLHNRAGEHDKAIASLEACLREEPGYPKAHFQLSFAYRRLGNEEKAKQYQESYDQLQNAATERTQKARGMDNKPPER